MPRKYKNRHRGKKKSPEINKIIKEKLLKYTNYVNKNSIFHKHVEKLELGVVILPQLFDGIECKIIESTCKMQGAHIINDRHDDRSTIMMYVVDVCSRFQEKSKCPQSFFL